MKQLRQKCLNVIHQEIQEIIASREDPIEQSVIAFGALYMAHHEKDQPAECGSGERVPLGDGVSNFNQGATRFGRTTLQWLLKIQTTLLRLTILKI